MAEKAEGPETKIAEMAIKLVEISTKLVEVQAELERECEANRELQDRLNFCEMRIANLEIELRELANRNLKYVFTKTRTKEDEADDLLASRWFHYQRPWAR